MKYGIILYENTPNFGDNILSFAASRLLPQVDYTIDIDHLDSFQSRDNEPVAALMSFWFLMRKWNWPPASCIIPKFVGFHYSDHIEERDRSPLRYEYLSGPGADYLHTYSPIGCRDLFTAESLREHGFETYFSGCISLTISNIPDSPPPALYNGDQEYICLVDIPEKVTQRIKDQLSGTGLQVLEHTHSIEFTSEISWAQREKMVEDRLALYKNAKCVISNRLHVTLPCLAMETPVLTISNKLNVPRFQPYKDWIYATTPRDFMDNNYIYDICYPPEPKNVSALSGAVD